MTERLAIFLPTLDGGGAERVMVEIANGIAARGYNVDLVLASAKGPYLREVSSGVRVVDLQCSRILKSLPKLVSYLRRERPTAMLSALRHANIIAVIARILSFKTTRLVISERNHVSVAFQHPLSLRLRILKNLMRLMYIRADSIVAVSQGVADDLSSLIGSTPPVEVIYNPVSVSRVRELAAKSPEHLWFEPGQPPVILGVGRLEAQKDFSTLLKAFARVRQTHSARLVILGEGKLESELKAEVSELGLDDCVDFAGFVDNPYAFMRAASLLVLSSAWEGLPNVLIQAMACGTAVVSTNCPSGPDEILESGQWGRLVPVSDEQSLAKAIVATLDDPTPPDVKLRAEDFNLEHSVEAYLEVLLGTNDVG